MLPSGCRLQKLRTHFTIVLICRQISHILLTSSDPQACRLRSSELTSYLQYCKEVVFSEVTVPPALKGVSSFLEQLASSEQSDPGQPESLRRQPPDAGDDEVTEMQQRQPPTYSLDSSSSQGVHSQPDHYTGIPAYIFQSETMHPDVLAVAAACGALVNVHPDIILRQMASLQHSLSSLQKLLLTDNKS